MVSLHKSKSRFKFEAGLFFKGAFENLCAPFGSRVYDPWAILLCGSVERVLLEHDLAAQAGGHSPAGGR